MSVTMFSKIHINLSCCQKYELDVHTFLKINDTKVLKGAKRRILHDKNYSEGGIKIFFKFHVPSIPLK